MEKKSALVWMTLILLIILLIGCVSTKTSEEKILGSWITERSVGQEETAVFTFFPNGTFSLEIKVNESNGDFITYTIWETYTITDEKLVMILEGETEILEYFFSNNDNTLTLIEDNGESTILFRQ